MLTPSEVLDLDYHHQLLWDMAKQQGYVLAQKHGYLEQTPYTLDDPLFDAFREGWLDGIQALSLEEFDLRPESTPELRWKLELMWREVLRQTRENGNKQSLTLTT